MTFLVVHDTREGFFLRTFVYLSEDAINLCIKEELQLICANKLSGITCRYLTSVSRLMG